MASHSPAIVTHGASGPGGEGGLMRLPSSIDDEETGGGGIEGQPFSVVSFDAPYSILDANDAWCEMVGFPKAKIVGRTLRMLQGPSTNVGSLKEIVQSCQQGGTFTGIITFYSQSGNELLCVVTARLYSVDGDMQGDACRLTMIRSEASVFCMTDFSSEKLPQLVISLPEQEVAHANPAFRQQFKQDDSVIGKKVSELHGVTSVQQWKRMMHACCSGISVRLSMVLNEMACAQFECMVRAVPRLAENSSARAVDRILLTYEVDVLESESVDGIAEASSKTAEPVGNEKMIRAEIEEAEFLKLLARTPSSVLSKSKPDWMESPLMGIARERTERKMANHLSKMQSIIGLPPSASTAISSSSSKVNTNTIELNLALARRSIAGSAKPQWELGGRLPSCESNADSQSSQSSARSHSAGTSPALSATASTVVVAGMPGSSTGDRSTSRRAVMKTDRALQRHLQLMASRRPSASSSVSSVRGSSSSSVDSGSSRPRIDSGCTGGSESGGSPSGSATSRSPRDNPLRHNSGLSLNQKVMAVMSDSSLSGKQRHKQIQELRRKHTDVNGSDKKPDKVQPTPSSIGAMTVSHPLPESVAEEGICTPLSAIFPAKFSRGVQDRMNLTSPNLDAVMPLEEDVMAVAACRPLSDVHGDQDRAASQWDGLRRPGSHLIEAGIQDESLSDWRMTERAPSSTAGSFPIEVENIFCDSLLDKSGGVNSSTAHDGGQHDVDSLVRNDVDSLVRRQGSGGPFHTDANGMSCDMIREEARASSFESRTSSNGSSCSNESRCKAEKALTRVQKQRRREEMHVEAAIERLGGDKEGVYALAMQFLDEDFPSKVASLQQAISVGDFEESAKISSSMIDLAEAIGAVSLLERLEPLASLKGYSSTTASVDSKVDMIDVELGRIRLFWRKFEPA